MRRVRSRLSASQDVLLGDLGSQPPRSLDVRRARGVARQVVALLVQRMAAAAQPADDATLLGNRARYASCSSGVRRPRGGEAAGGRTNLAFAPRPNLHRYAIQSPNLHWTKLAKLAIPVSRLGPGCRPRTVISHFGGVRRLEGLVYIGYFYVRCLPPLHVHIHVYGKYMYIVR